MWQAAAPRRQKKPVIISVGGMAASGGYYLASAGDYIFADPSAIVGSIGVVGGKFVFKDLSTSSASPPRPSASGRNADLFSSTKPFDERQRRHGHQLDEETYEQFTERVMTTRKGKIKDIDQVARGRIFLAKQAKELGMVDEIGGRAGRDRLRRRGRSRPQATGTYDVKILPAAADAGRPARSAARGAEAATPIRPKIQIDCR